MNGAPTGLVATILERIAPRLRHPHLFLLILALFLADLVLPDPIPFADEAMLALLTVLLGTWRTRRPKAEVDPAAPPKDVTDRGSDDGRPGRT
jgi:hypothetical protein